MCTCNVCIDYIMGAGYPVYRDPYDSDDDMYEDPRRYFIEFADAEEEDNIEIVKEHHSRIDPKKVPLSIFKERKKYNRAIKVVRRKELRSIKKENRRQEHV